jgi:hypothetical protein
MGIDRKQRNKVLSSLPQENMESYANGRVKYGFIALGEAATVTV